MRTCIRKNFFSKSASMIDMILDNLMEALLRMGSKMHAA